MRIRYGVFVVLASTALSACGSAALDTDDQKASYGIGMDMGRNLGPAASHLDREAFLRGLEDAVEGREPAISSEEMREVYQRFTAMLQAEEEAQRGAASEKNAAEGAAYLAENGARDGVTTTASGLQYEVLREGDGPRPGPHDQVTIHYRGTLIDGT
ncbi:MAG: FKBP-type peptidyl-prolyl cis-trans isomerase N-terminal domain-containing protein, partial [Gemmatimonadota bacterium]|nr:FKBP-type peptidyl-prolyl cis-trans isomerase N-terminal domain-containing protein [Gemmatimonadota bacterium]